MSYYASILPFNTLEDIQSILQLNINYIPLNGLKYYHMLLASLYKEIQPFHDYYQQSSLTLSYTTYEQVQQRKEESNQIKQLIKPRLHILTMSSHETIGLLNLQRLSYFIGINIQILRNDTYINYKTKMLTYYNYIQEAYQRKTIQLKDLILIIDAFDVMIFPSILQYLKVSDNTFIHILYLY